jgi:hypothetical protein
VSCGLEGVRGFSAASHGAPPVRRGASACAASMGINLEVKGAWSRSRCYVLMTCEGWPTPTLPCACNSQMAARSCLPTGVASGRGATWLQRGDSWKDDGIGPIATGQIGFHYSGSAAVSSASARAASFCTLRRFPAACSLSRDRSLDPQLDVFAQRTDANARVPSRPTLADP